jgi:transcriptional regulator with XRE-family HTH domain
MDNLVANTVELGKWIRDNRKIKGMTLEELSARAGMSKQYLSMIERAVGQPGSGNPVVPSRDIIRNICKALHVSPTEPFRMAGYTTDGDQYNLAGGTVLMFQEESKLTDEQREKIIEHVNLIVSGIVNQQIAEWLQNAPSLPNKQT